MELLVQRIRDGRSTQFDERDNSARMRICLYHITEPVLMFRVHGGSERFNQVASGEAQIALSSRSRSTNRPTATCSSPFSAGMRTTGTTALTTRGADHEESAFRTIPVFRATTINRARNNESTGGWIELNVEPQSALVDDMPGPMAGVLTWAEANSPCVTANGT